MCRRAGHDHQAHAGVNRRRRPESLRYLITGVDPIQIFHHENVLLVRVGFSLFAKEFYSRSKQWSIASGRKDVSGAVVVGGLTRLAPTDLASALVCAMSRHIGT